MHLSVPVSIGKVKALELHFIKFCVSSAELSNLKHSVFIYSYTEKCLEINEKKILKKKKMQENAI